MDLATKSYKAGDEIIASSSPLAHVIKSQFRLKYCASCLEELTASGTKPAPIDVVKCDNCHSMAYCSMECKQLDWDTYGHKLECKMFAASHDTDFDSGSDAAKSGKMKEPRAFYMSRLAYRLWLLNRSKPGYLSGLHKMHNKSKISFNHLTSKVDLFDNDRLEECRDVLASMWVNGDMKESYSETIHDELMHILGRLIQSAKLVYVNALPIGLAIYLEASPFEHSCISNATVSTDGLNMSVRALCPIKKGERMTINLVEPFQTVSERKAALSDWPYFFDCKCARCETHDGYRLSENKNSCREPNSNRYFNSMRLLIHAQELSSQQGENMTSTDLVGLTNEIEEHLAFLEKAISPVKYHMHISNTLAILYGVYLMRISLLGASSDQIKHGGRMSINKPVSPLTALNGHHTSRNGRGSLPKGRGDKFRLQIAMEKFGQVYDRLMEHMSVTHGKEHNLYRLLPIINCPCCLFRHIELAY